jgi:hypothetical protein
MLPADAGGVRRANPVVGLCANCQHVHQLRSARGSTFYLCRRAETDPAYARYPRIPVLACPGYAPHEHTPAA